MVFFPFMRQCNIQILLNLRLQEPAVLPALCFCIEIAFVILGVIQKYGRKNFQTGES